jgi:hypothetical protein
VVIDAELGMENHCSIPATAIWIGLKPVDAEIDSQTKLGVLVNRIPVVKTKMKTKQNYKGEVWRQTKPLNKTTKIYNKEHQAYYKLDHL